MMTTTTNGILIICTTIMSNVDTFRDVCDWPHSTFHRLVEQGIYHKDWGIGNVDEFDAGEFVSA